MNIAIITLPLHVNYGGLLQAYALQYVLKAMGHNVVTLDIPSKIKPELSLYRQIRAFVGTTLNVLLGRDRFSNIYWPLNNNKRNMHAVRMSMRPFMRKIMNISSPLFAEKELIEYCEHNSIDAIVVGSDQVWRPRYNSNIDFSYLSFLPENSAIKRIAVSASFGTDAWEYTPEQTEKYSCLAQQFNAISVRELSGVDLCKNYLHVDAIQTIDPTMMLIAADYDKIIELDAVNTQTVKSKIFSYIIDDTKAKSKLINHICKVTNMDLFEMNPNERPTPYSSVSTALRKAPKPLAQWLRAIKESELVVTDSFHGTVFSILYHRPFIILSNKSRGLARIETLLEMFGLENRMIDPDSLCDNKVLSMQIKAEIDWDNVDDILQSKRMELKNFISQSLNS